MHALGLSFGRRRDSISLEQRRSLLGQYQNVAASNDPVASGSIRLDAVARRSDAPAARSRDRCSVVFGTEGGAVESVPFVAGAAGAAAGTGQAGVGQAGAQVVTGCR
jgi:hypothetical protein